MGKSHRSTSLYIEHCSLVEVTGQLCRNEDSVSTVPQRLQLGKVIKVGHSLTFAERWLKIGRLDAISMLRGYLGISLVSVINKTANEVYIGCFGENNVPKASNVINFRGVILVRVDGP